jgi:hypothetical protein
MERDLEKRDKSRGRGEGEEERFREREKKKKEKKKGECGLQIIRTRLGVRFFYIIDVGQN